MKWTLSSMQNLLSRGRMDWSSGAAQSDSDSDLPEKKQRKSKGRPSKPTATVERPSRFSVWFV